MVKKLFALASVTALAGLVSAVGVTGCTSESDPVDSTPNDAGTDVKVKPDAANGDDDDDDDGDLCYKEDPVDAKDVKYAPPRIQEGACEESVFATMKNLPQGSTYADLKAAIKSKEGDACAACVFALEGATWAPVLEDNAGKIVNLNVGGCIEIVSGKPACGKAFQQWNTCIDFVCQNCEGAEAQSCSSGAMQTACKDATTELVTACGGETNTQNYIDACNKQGEFLISGPIRAQCVGGMAPGTPDAGDGGN